ncbi:MAG: molybdopterin-dependent oxidoreductase [Chloroflexi bacterium]|nr:molybdopterin-dependent oxidoreductase [Chloroflexota bacterium]
MADTIVQPELVVVDDTEIITSVCGVCPAGCGMNVHVRAGKIVRVSPIKEHPYSTVCPRGMVAAETVYSPDRILTPQQRVGNKGAGQFERISWHQAYERIVEEFHRIARQYGPEAIAIYTGRGNFEFGLNEMFAPTGPSESSANTVLFPFGSPNTTGVGSLCFVSYGMIAPQACFGTHMREMDEDIDHADLILVWGENPVTDSSPINLKRLRQARKRGARIIVIDHRRSETVHALQSEWIGVRPGTDGALALGAIHVLIDEALYDHAFVENWVHGFAELRDYVRQFTPERVQAITWVPAEKVRELARALSKARGCSILTYTGLEYSNSGVQALRAMFSLQALAGHLDVPGGKRFLMRDRLKLNRHLSKPPAHARKAIGADEFPIYHEVRNEAHGALLPQAILEDKPYPLRAMIISGSSVITSWPNPELWRRALAALDFLVVVNRFPTADSHYADIFLPATTQFEIESYVIHDSHVQLRQRAIPPLGEARNDYLIFAELAKRLGYGHLWPQTEEAMIDYALKDTGVCVEDLRRHPQGITYPQPEFHYRKYMTGELRTDEQPGFETPTGKFEITSEWLRSHGYEALPVYTEPCEGPLASPELAQHYPLVFNSGARSLYAFRSQHHNIPSLVAKHPYPLVQIHPTDAQPRRIADGDAVWVISPRGRVPFTAYVSADIVPGVVEANMGGGGPLGTKAWRQANVNALTDLDNFDPISGFPVYKALLCDVIKRTPLDS